MTMTILTLLTAGQVRRMVQLCLWERRRWKFDVIYMIAIPKGKQ